MSTEPLPDRQTDSDVDVNSDFWLTKEVAAKLRVGESLLSKWRKRGVGPPWHDIEGQIRYDKVLFQRYLDERLQGAA